MRGDRPYYGNRNGQRLRASPHARGSTHRVAWCGHRVQGFPACAGIDRRILRAEIRDLRLPRMRGDRPQGLTRSGSGDRASPHARGSTPARILDRRLVRGFPACAGIDLYRRVHGVGTTWLPRMRGDRPAPQGRTQDWDAASPHARGSTYRHGLRDWVTRGFPACAGIDPSPTHGRTRRGRLPRMRGDRPQDCHWSRCSTAASPHARGDPREADQ